MKTGMVVLIAVALSIVFTIVWGNKKYAPKAA